MSVKKYDVRFFDYKISENEVITFKCWCTDTRSGFCHSCDCLDRETTITKVSYLNRTWETFRYETVLKRALLKVGLNSSLVSNYIVNF